MKNITLISLYLLLTNQILYCQTYDTMAYNVGLKGGFERIREFDKNDTIIKVWTKIWKNDGNLSSSYTQYNTSGKRIIYVDTIFNINNNIISIERKIGDTIEGDEQFFDLKGNLIKRYISMYVNDKYVIYQKYYSNGWKYRAIIDGYPPDYITINPERFEEAIKIYNDKVFKNRLSN